jgi:hypothetical protein
VTNNQGSWFSVTTRAETTQFFKPAFSGIVWFLTEQGLQPTLPIWSEGDIISGFLATTTMDLEAAASTWTDALDVSMTFGHRAEDHLTIHGDLSLTNRVMFQWAAGCYVHPALVDYTVKVMKMYNLLHHGNFDVSYISMVWNQPIIFLRFLTRFFADISEGPNISGANVHVYKHRGVVLSSLEDFNTGMRSGQAWPWVANVDGIAVWTQSGVDRPSFEGAPRIPTNTLLPDVRSNKNVAFITYTQGNNPFERTLLRYFLGSVSTRVGLFFPEDRFDEVRKDGNWILGRKNESYIGVYRPGGETRNDCSLYGNGTHYDPYYCSDPAGSGGRSQSWAVVVGNSATHSSFTNFAQIVGTGQVSQRTSFSLLRGVQHEMVLSVDGKELRASA